MIGALWAQSLDGVIGDGSAMPWHIPEDLAHFRQLTVGYPVVMGRRTWLSLPEKFRPLPGRDNYIISSSPAGSWSAGADVLADATVGTLAARLPRSQSAAPSGWIIGGGQLYSATIDLVDRLEVTVVGVNIADIYGDAAVYAPEIPAEFGVVAQSDWQLSENGHLSIPGYPPSELPLKYRFISYARKQPA